MQVECWWCNNDLCECAEGSLAECTSGLFSGSSPCSRGPGLAPRGVRSDLPALGSSFALFRLLTISLMDDLVPFL